MSVLLWKPMLANQRSRKGNASIEACCIQSLINYCGRTSELGGSWPTTVQYVTLWASTFVELSWRCPIRIRCRVYVTVGCPSVSLSVPSIDICRRIWHDDTERESQVRRRLKNYILKSKMADDRYASETRSASSCDIAICRFSRWRLSVIMENSVKKLL